MRGRVLGLNTEEDYERRCCLVRESDRLALPVRFGDSEQDAEAGADLRDFLTAHGHPCT